jgi:Protein of unknown function (DUF2752)
VSRQLALLWGAVAGTLLAASPWAPALGGALWECTFKSWTGIPCPTCGTARAALALARLDVLEAVTRYPLPAIGWIVLLAGGLVAAAMALLGREPPSIPNRLPVWGRVAVVAAVLGNWAYSIVTGV